MADKTGVIEVQGTVEECLPSTMFRVRLNEWRPDQYVDLVARHFKILNQYGVMREGEEFLIRTQKPS